MTSPADASIHCQPHPRGAAGLASKSSLSGRVWRKRTDPSRPLLGAPTRIKSWGARVITLAASTTSRKIAKVPAKVDAKAPGATMRTTCGGSVKATQSWISTLWLTVKREKEELGRTCPTKKRTSPRRQRKTRRSPEDKDDEEAESEADWVAGNGTLPILACSIF